MCPGIQKQKPGRCGVVGVVTVIGQGVGKDPCAESPLSSGLADTDKKMILKWQSTVPEITYAGVCLVIPVTQ